MGVSPNNTPIGQTLMAKTTVPIQANPNVVATTTTNNVYANTKPMHIYMMMWRVLKMCLLFS
jgi:hypothetical protein